MNFAETFFEMIDYFIIKLILLFPSIFFKENENFENTSKIGEMAQKLRYWLILVMEWAGTFTVWSVNNDVE